MGTVPTLQDGPGLQSIRWLGLLFGCQNGFKNKNSNLLYHFLIYIIIYLIFYIYFEYLFKINTTLRIDKE